MSADVKAFGVLKFASRDDLDDLDPLEDEDGDEATAEVRALVNEGTKRKGKSLTLAIRGSLTADANVVLQEWLTDVAECAESGHVDTWQDTFGEAYFVRVHAGGREETVTGSFPAS